MEVKDLAALLNGREYGDEITTDEQEQAKAAGLVIVYGYSDDCVELDGAINNELGAYGGVTFKVNANGLVPRWEDVEHGDEEACERYFRIKSAPANAIKADYVKGVWIIRAGIPHSTFEVMEDGELFCRGIVFRLADAGGPMPDPECEPWVDKAQDDPTPVLLMASHWFRALHDYAFSGPADVPHCDCEVCEGLRGLQAGLERVQEFETSVKGEVA